MGETLGIVCKTKKHANNLLTFFDDNWDIVVDNLNDYISEFLKIEDPFWVNSNIFETKITTWGGCSRELLCTILRWGALKSGRRKRAFPNLHYNYNINFEDPVLYTIYGNYDRWPVLFDDYGKEYDWCFVDELGILRKPEQQTYLAENAPGYIKLIRDIFDGKIKIPNNVFCAEYCARKLKDEIKELVIPLRICMEELELKWSDTY